MGGVEVLVCCGAYPTLNKYDYRGHCPVPSPCDSKVLRITIPLAAKFQEIDPSSSVPYFILIIGDHGGAHFTVWAKASYPSTEREDIMGKVTTLQLLSEYGPKNLVHNFQKLHDETVKAVSHRSTPNSVLRSLSDKNLMEEDLRDFTSDSDDDASMFLKKSGVYALKNASLSEAGGLDPNLSIELFNRDVLTSKKHTTPDKFSREMDSLQMAESSGDLAKLMCSLKESQAYKNVVRTRNLPSGKSRSSAGTTKRKPHRLEPLRYTLTIPPRSPNRQRKDFV